MATMAVQRRSSGRSKKTTKPRKCMVCKKEKTASRGLCMKHYQQVRRQIIDGHLADWDAAVQLGLCRKEWADYQPNPIVKKIASANARNAK